MGGGIEAAPSAWELDRTPENERRVGVALSDPLFLRSTFLRITFLLHVGPGLFGVKPMHQQPPKIPLLRSTNAANAAHVD
jgi:hypothetical protein